MQLVLSFSDTVVYMDADALIVNTSISFPSLLASLDGAYSTSTKDIVYTTDFQSGRATEPTPYSLINSGVYIVRSTNWTKVRQALCWQSTVLCSKAQHRTIVMTLTAFLSLFRDTEGFQCSTLVHSTRAL